MHHTYNFTRQKDWLEVGVDGINGSRQTTVICRSRKSHGRKEFVPAPSPSAYRARGLTRVAQRQ